MSAFKPTLIRLIRTYIFPQIIPTSLIVGYQYHYNRKIGTSLDAISLDLDSVREELKEMRKAISETARSLEELPKTIEDRIKIMEEHDGNYREVFDGIVAIEGRAAANNAWETKIRKGYEK